jgi:ADP-ribose pyrophosphatase
MPAKNRARVVFKGKFFCVRRKGKWDYVERISLSGVVAILALTSDEKIILTEQFRVPFGKRVVALPAGLAGDEGKEQLIDAAKRELLEETGHAAKRWELLTEGPSSSGLSDEITSIFVAVDVRRKAAIDPDAGEKIEVHEIPLRHLSAWLERKRKAGRLIDYKIFAALYLAGSMPRRVARAPKTTPTAQAKGRTTVKKRSR